MIRLVLREALMTVLMLALVSLGAFIVLDATGTYDWWGALTPALRAGVPRETALCRNLPEIWNQRVVDAQVRTLDDLAQLANPGTRAAASARLQRRGTAALPTILEQLPTLGPAAREPALEVLSAMAPAMTGGERPPQDPVSAMAYWASFDALRGLDFRAAYATRQVQRLLYHESANAEEQLARLGTFSFPAVFSALDEPLESDSALRLTNLLADLTGKSLRIPPGATAEQTRDVVELWRAWWFAEQLEYETLSDVGRSLGHVTQTRYGRWLDRVLSGRSTLAIATGQPAVKEFRERLPASAFIAGLGGLIATALVVAFGGGSVLRRRPLKTKFLDLAGALIPGLTAFVFGFLALLQLCAAPEPAGALSRQVLSHWLRLSIAVAMLTPLAVLWLRRRSERVALHAVRHEAESWAIESRHPHIGQVLRHGFRVGVASLLAPMGLSALPLLGLTIVVEPIVGVRGMGALTLESIPLGDAPWILLAVLSIVPVWFGHRWSRTAMIWALGDPAKRPAPPLSIVPPAMSLAPPPIVAIAVPKDMGERRSLPEISDALAIPKAPKVPKFDDLEGLEREGPIGHGSPDVDPEPTGR